MEKKPITTIQCHVGQTSLPFPKFFCYITKLPEKPSYYNSPQLLYFLNPLLVSFCHACHPIIAFLFGINMLISITYFFLFRAVGREGNKCKARRDLRILAMVPSDETHNMQNSYVMVVVKLHIHIVRKKKRVRNFP